MRLRAVTQKRTFIYPSISDKTQKTLLEKNTEIILIGNVKNGTESFYLIENMRSYINRSDIKILRDEEFYYTSFLIKKKENRSKDSFYNTYKNIMMNMPTVASLQPMSFQQGIANSVAANGGRANFGSVAMGIGGALINQIGTNYVNGLLNKVGYDESVKSVAQQLSSSDIPLVKGIGGATNTSNYGVSIFGSGLFGSVLNTITGTAINSALTGQKFDLEATIKNAAITSVNSYLNTLMRKLGYAIGLDGQGSLLTVIHSLMNGDYITLGKELDKVYKKSFKYTYYAQRDEQIKNYFKYRGCKGLTIFKNSTLGYGYWEENASYMTGTMTPKQNPDEVQLHKTLYNNLYSDFKDSLESVKDSVNLNINRADWFVNFNRFRLIHPDSVLTNSKGYVFFTRPDINVDTDMGSSDIGLLYTNISTRHPYVVKQLMKLMTGGHYFMPILGNRCTGLEISDESIETKELAETLTGWKLNYGGNLIKSKSAGTVTTSFIDDESLSIYLIFKLWVEYISAVSRGIVKPAENYLKTKQLDYANSIYYFLTAADGETILFWSKYTGCIPTNIPSSNFSDGYTDSVKAPKYSISWAYAFKKDYDPYSLAEFNRLSSASSLNYEAVYNPNTLRSTKTLAGAPFVETIDGGKSFKLRFRPIVGETPGNI